MGHSARIFVVYGHHPPDHRDRIRGLAQRLKDDGLSIVIDAWVRPPPDGWPAWCEHQLCTANSVLIAPPPLTETDASRDHGLGMQWELNLIRNILYHRPQEHSRFVVISPRAGLIDAIPLILRDCSRFDDADDYPALLTHLRGSTPADLHESQEVRRLLIRDGEDRDLLPLLERYARGCLGEAHLYRDAFRAPALVLSLRRSRGRLFLEGFPRLQIGGDFAERVEIPGQDPSLNVVCYHPRGARSVGPSFELRAEPGRIRVRLLQDTHIAAPQPPLVLELERLA